MAIKSIDKKNVSMEVFEQIKNNIISGEWKSGDKTPSENELKKLFGVSRNTVRAALQHLAALDIIVTRHGEGNFVGELTPGLYMNSLMPTLVLGNVGLLEILEFRKIIEIEGVKLAVERAEPKDIKELEEITDNMLKNSYNAEEFGKYDLCFHETLIRCTRNSLLIKVNSITKDLILSQQINIQKLIGPAVALKYHPMILDAVRKKDFVLASNLMEDHLNGTIEEAKLLISLEE